MNIGKAAAIFQNINSEDFTDYEKLEAIDMVLDMPTHNGITKGQILDVCRWMKAYVIGVAKRV